MLQKYWFYLVTLFSVVALASALIAEYYFDLQPCAMCLKQREPYYLIIAGFFLVMILKWQDKIWLPPLYFSNAAGNIPIASGDTVGVKVLKQGIPNLKNVMELNEGNIFLGKENDLELNAKHEGLFRCNYKLSNFPFDTQRCSINIKVPNEIKNFTNINPKQLIYSGTNNSIKLLYHKY